MGGFERRQHPEEHSGHHRQRRMKARPVLPRQLSLESKLSKLEPHLHFFQTVQAHLPALRGIDGPLLPLEEEI